MDAKRRRWVAVAGQLLYLFCLRSGSKDLSRSFCISTSVFPSRMFPTVGCAKQVAGYMQNQCCVRGRHEAERVGSIRFGFQIIDVGYNFRLRFQLLELVISRRPWVASNDRPHHMTFKVSALVTCYVQHRSAADGIGYASEESAQRPGA
jgi:hypothetical protein